MKKYEKLKSTYPAYVSLEQLYTICKISKRSARYLIANGIIPSIDTEKKTWRYKISIDDVIAYLRRRRRYGSMIPVGAVNDCKTRRRQSYSQVVDAGMEQNVVKYLSSVFVNTPDVLTVDDMATVTGLNKKTFFRIINTGHLKVLTRYPRYIASKVHFWEFIASHRFIDLWSNSEEFIRILEGFKIWEHNQKKTV